MMYAVLRRSMIAPLHYWRTALLVMASGVLATALSDDALAVLLTTLACAFVFGGYERRQWINIPFHSQTADVVLRLAFALLVTRVLTWPM